MQTRWGREMLIAQDFAKELAITVAITAYKRAMFLMPSPEKQRLQRLNIASFKHIIRVTNLQKR